MQRNEKLEAGAIVLQKEIENKEKNTSQEIHDELAKIGGKLINDALKILQKEEKIKTTPQDEASATYAKKISTDEAKINWNKNGKDVLRQIKAFNPTPGAWFTVNNERIKIFDADISSSKNKPRMHFVRQLRKWKETGKTFLRKHSSVKQKNSAEKLSKIK